MVNFSGGAGSFAAASRVVDRFGAAAVTLLAADTRSEADDWRPFMDAAAAHLGAEMVMLADGRDIWELATAKRAIPSVHKGFCSQVLKQDLLDRWYRDNCDPAETMQYVGFDWTEEHRLVRLRARRAPWQVDAPMMWDPPLSKTDALEMVAAAGLPNPLAYQLGLGHNNCLKYGCVKAGRSYWTQLLRLLPESYARSEAEESRMRTMLGGYSILTEKAGGVTRALPLAELRRRVEQQPDIFDDEADWGPCGCFDDDSTDQSRDVAPAVTVGVPVTLVASGRGARGG